jgi:hypothetical protein
MGMGMGIVIRIILVCSKVFSVRKPRIQMGTFGVKKNLRVSRIFLYTDFRGIFLALWRRNSPPGGWPEGWGMLSQV